MDTFISIDGVDGVGKTTVAKLLAADGDFQYYKSPSGPFEALRKEVDGYASRIGRYCFYRLATQYDSQEIAKLLEKGPVVSDRYLPSTYAYHVVLDPRVRDIHQEIGLLKPNFAFLLSARTEVRIQRLTDRRLKEGRDVSDIKLEDNVVVMDSVAAVFRTMRLLEIDTSDMTAKEVVARIKEIVKSGGQNGS